VLAVEPPRSSGAGTLKLARLPRLEAPGFTGCGKIRSTAVSLRGRGFSFSRAVSRLFVSTALAAGGRSRAEVDFFSSLYRPLNSGACLMELKPRWRKSRARPGAPIFPAQSSFAQE
jgi:hypothetical protein